MVSGTILLVPNNWILYLNQSPKEDFTVPASVTITGFTTTTFSTMRGEPNAAMSITVNGGISSKTITINRAGGMSVN